MKVFYSVLVLTLLFGFSMCVPKYEDTKSTYPDNEWRRSGRENDTYPSSTQDRIQRLGYGSSGYGNSISGYPHSASGVGSYYGPKIDIGGVVLGAVIGVGALLIIPKIVGIFSGGYGGGHYRSANDDPMGLNEMVSKIDEFLSQNNIDSSICMQRALCNYVRSSEYHMSVGTADQMEQLIHSLSGNTLVDYMISGTAMKQALENGKNMDGQSCDTVYSSCTMDRNSVMQLLTNLLPKSAAQ